MAIKPKTCPDCGRPTLNNFSRCAGHLLKNRLVMRAARNNIQRSRYYTDDELMDIALNEEKHPKEWLLQSKD
jgi:hypothetical protein